MLKQLSIFVENEIGSLAKVTSVLKENNLNLRAIASFDTPEFGILRIVVDQPEKTKQILTSLGFAVKITDVVAVELIDRPGDLDRVLNILAEAGLCINYIYSFVLRHGNAPLMVLSVDDRNKATAVLKDNNVKVIEEENI